MMNILIQDIKYGFRVLLQNPVTSLIAVLALAIGVGVNVAVFSMVNAVLLRGLPFHNPARLVMIYGSNSQIPKFPLSNPDYMDLKQQATAFQQLGAYFLRSQENIVLLKDGEPVSIHAALISHDLFPLMGITLEHGRSFLAREEQAGDDQVVILSHRLWQQQYASRPDIIGKQLNINNQLLTVIGVVRERDQFPDEADVWMPLSRLGKQDLASRDRHRLYVIGRLKAGVTETQSRTELQSIAQRLSLTYPEADKDAAIVQVNLLTYYTGSVQKILAVLFGAASLILLIACVNIANLLLGRAAGRRKEIAIRLAIGASRSRVAWQLVVESLLLAGLGTVCGLLIALCSCYILRNWTAANTFMPRLSETSIDPVVLAYAVGITFFTGLVFGAWPAMKTSRLDLNNVLREAGNATHTPMREPMRNLLIASEVAIAVVVLVSTMQLIRSLRELNSVDPGFRTDNTLTVQLSLSLQRYGKKFQRVDFYRQLLTNVRALPGVEGASAIDILPLVPSLGLMHFGVEGVPVGPIAVAPVAQIRTVAPGYFEFMHIPVLKGRNFSEQDTLPNAPGCFIINETLARLYFPGRDPVGRGVVIVEAPTPFTVPIVGVVADVKDLGVDRKPEPEIFAVGYLWNGVLLVRTAIAPLSITTAIRHAVRSVDPYQPIGSAMTMKQIIEQSLARRFLLASLMSVFSGLALILSVIGIYGVMAYTVAQRTSEIGIRMAIGADNRAILTLLLRQGMLPVIAGLAVGLVGAWSLRTAMAGLLYGISPWDISTYLSIAAVTIIVGVVAILIPSRRAININPQVSLTGPPPMF
jgi:putative ABC transport system permease protein